MNHADDKSVIYNKKDRRDKQNLKMIRSTDFGQFISEQKEKRSIQSQELADRIGISKGYLSQIEHGKRLCHGKELLPKIAEALELSDEERYKLYDLYAAASGRISPDIEAYIRSSPVIVQVLRKAHDVGATVQQWEEIIDLLEK